MSTLTCFCGLSCFDGAVVATLDMHRHIGCARLCYSAHGSSFNSIVGKFKLELTGYTLMEVPEHFVDILLFWHANINVGVYKIHLDKCDAVRDESVIYVSDGEIYFNGQFIEPIVQFTVIPEKRDSFRLKFLDKYCYTINVIALSLAMNGAHLLY